MTSKAHCALAALLLAALWISEACCGITAGKLLREERETRSTHPLVEADALVLCDGAPCDGVPTVLRESVGWRAPLFFGSLVDLSLGGVLLGKENAFARVGGYALLTVGAIELLLQLSERFDRPVLDGRAAILWRDRRIDLVPDDLSYQDLRDRKPISAAEIVERRKRPATPPVQSSQR